MVFSQLNNLCPNVLALVDLVLSIPAASTDAERGFNHMKLIKNDWRSRLKDTNLTNLMHILLNSDSVESFDPTSAVHLWNSSSTRARRITKKHPKIPKIEKSNENENEVQSQDGSEENESQTESQTEDESQAEESQTEEDTEGDQVDIVGGGAQELADVVGGEKEASDTESSDEDEDYFSDFSDQDAEEDAFDKFRSVDVESDNED